MPSLRSTTKSTFLFIPILVLFISFLLTLSQVSVVDGDCTEQKNNDTLIIGVPGKASFENSVKISNSKNQDERNYSGFCIRVFEEVRRILGSEWRYKFVEFNGTYDELVDSVANKLDHSDVAPVPIDSCRATPPPQPAAEHPPSNPRASSPQCPAPFSGESATTMPPESNPYVSPLPAPASFVKSSSLVANVSEAILELSEDGTLKRLEEVWLAPYKVCLKSYPNMTENMMEENVDSLSLRSFWGLFLFSVGTFTVCFLLFLGHLLRNYCRHQSSQVADVNVSNESVSVRTVRVARYLMNAEIRSPIHGDLHPAVG
ncbi:hypothetical protein RHSIM_Rhsim13G0183500 [Rhododendron simsii]|uniref:Uncharacterized protein n=1 Tax=Rhododendron simsii TaxID=118357 RepID=A0A834G1U1_RHOSS|nr:hypothetical protein RHSIM_Rhsim13G0183500 [Rhododendron simsii]